MFNYSTNFYRTKATDVIARHDPTVPLFLYLPFQAVHDPFSDIREGADGPTPKFFVPGDMQARIAKEVVGAKRTEYAYALAILDDAVRAALYRRECVCVWPHSWSPLRCLALP